MSSSSLYKFYFALLPALVAGETFSAGEVIPITLNGAHERGVHQSIANIRAGHITSVTLPYFSGADVNPTGPVTVTPGSEIIISVISAATSAISSIESEANSIILGAASTSTSSPRGSLEDSLM